MKEPRGVMAVERVLELSAWLKAMCMSPDDPARPKPPEGWWDNQRTHDTREWFADMAPVFAAEIKRLRAIEIAAFQLLQSDAAIDGKELSREVCAHCVDALRAALERADGR